MRTPPARRGLASALVAVPVALLVSTLPAPASASSVPTGGASAVLSRMSLPQRVGQLFMVGTPAAGGSSSTLDEIGSYHVGNVILTGRSSKGTVATAKVTATLRSRATGQATYGVPLFVAIDQEGGSVQVLSGTGFSSIPSALTQGTWATTTLRDRAARWGTQLRSAGVNVDLAPVTDTVPSAEAAENNPPIGFYHREFGYTTTRVAAHARAFLRGMTDADVASTTKHFPGLGRVTANPDTTAGVTDDVTTRHDAYIGPFAAAVDAGVPFLMMSTAYYSRIDSVHPAAFSSTVVTGMVRGDLGFTGVIVSDDLGAARQVAHWSPGGRALTFLRAGGDMVLTVDPSVLPAMYHAVLDQARSSASFRARVNASALRVLRAKQRFGLIPRAG